MGLFSMMASDTEATNQAAQGVLDGSLWYNLSSGTIDLTNTNNSFSENSMIFIRSSRQLYLRREIYAYRNCALGRLFKI